MKSVISAMLMLPLLAAQFGWLLRPDYFVPSNTLSGIGVSRADLSDSVLARRTELMIESQTFSILRDPQALEGAKRITGMKKLFDQASRASGLPASFIAAVAYLESWGLARAQSPAGPKGMMQIARGTAASMGLKITYRTRYRVSTTKRRVRTKKGKYITRTVRRRIPYTVLVRDERLIPSRAVPAAARYLARLQDRFGGLDWAVWAYHCGEGCIAQVRSIAERADGVSEPMSVPKVFFGASPARNRELYESLRYHMERDFSPTYWFRIMRAEQLLKMYQTDPASFRKLFEQYRNRANPVQRAPHRLTVWLTPEDLTYATCEDLRREEGRSLVRPFENPEYYGFSLSPGIGRDDPANREMYRLASPAALGTIAYIAYETRRLHEAMKSRREKYSPLEITALVMPRDAEERRLAKGEPLSHCSGQVFDINYGKLPPGQREALEFVLNDLGWDGYLGFVRDSSESTTYHVGASPTSRDFFTRIYQEAVEKSRATD
jgi:hypothetical protein